MAKIALTLFGISYFLIGLFTLIKHIKRKKEPFELVNGSIIYLKMLTESRGNVSNKSFCPIFGFTYRGQNYEVEHTIAIGNFGNPSEKHKVGTDVVLRVPTNSPYNATLNTCFNNNFLLCNAVLGIVIGSIVAVVGFLFL